MTKKIVKRATADGRRTLVRAQGTESMLKGGGRVPPRKAQATEPGLTDEQRDFILEGKPPSKADETFYVHVEFEWGLASAIRETILFFQDAQEAAEFVRVVVVEGFWLKAKGDAIEYVFIPWHRVLTVRAPEEVAAAMSERKVAG